ncbi:MAG: P-loop NTPase [Phycisphaerae bacterium]
MKIAIASGKGGAGKTTIATSLAAIGVQRGLSVAYLDCDVEEPNGHLFLHPVITGQEIVNIAVPEVDEKVCRAAGVCGRCGQACHFSAIICLGHFVMVNADLCHGCGACMLACQAHAIKEVPHRSGVVERGHAGELGFVQGRLDVGQAMATPIVRQVKAAAPPAEIILKDAPPGTSCPTVETARGSDAVLLVGEATPFGFHDFTLAVEMVRMLGMRAAAVLNRVDGPTREMVGWCQVHDIPILAQVSADRRVAEAYARGEMPIHGVPEFRVAMERLFTELLAWVKGEKS